MELFHETKNIYYEKIRALINDMVLNRAAYSKTDLERIFHYDENVEKLFLSKKTGGTEEKEYGLFLTENCDLRIPLPIPVLPTSCEMDYLWEVIHEESAACFLKEETREKLITKLSQGRRADGARLTERPDLFIRKGQKDAADQADAASCSAANVAGTKEFVSVLLDAILQDKKIAYEYCTGKGDWYQGTGIPYRFVYSNRLNRFQLILRTEAGETGESRFILMNVGNFISVSLLPESHVASEDREDILRKLKARRRSIVIEIEDARNTVERCFSLFSHLEKKAEYWEEENLHRIEMVYYDFDEEDIIRDLLSMGSTVLVKEPERMKRKMVEAIKGSYAALQDKTEDQSL